MPRSKPRPKLKGELNLSTNYFSKLKSVLLSPSKFFDSVKNEHDIKNPLKFALISSLISGVLSAIILMIASSFLPFGFLFGPIVAIGMIVIAVLTGLIAPLIGAAIYHIFAKLLKGSGSYSDTYKAVAYTQALVIISWIPLVGRLISFIWSLIIITIGISKVHSMSIGRAVLVWLIPLIIIIIVVVALFPSALSFLISAIFG